MLGEALRGGEEAAGVAEEAGEVRPWPATPAMSLAAVSLFLFGGDAKAKEVGKWRLFHQACYLI